MINRMSACWKYVRYLLSGAIVFLTLCPHADTHLFASTPEDERALDAATGGLCKAEVAMVGEIATHGDGHTVAFKVALVERLIDQCGFDAVFFEANQEEFIHLSQRLRAGDIKIIVWAATVHIAKQGDPTWGDAAGTNLGSLIHRRYGNHVRSLGFSALGGSFRQGKGQFPALPSAPADSVEALVLQQTASSATYVNAKQLTAMGTRPGAFFNHRYQTLAWARFLDGVVVFRTEHPPSDVR